MGKVYERLKNSSLLKHRLKNNDAIDYLWDKADMKKRTL
jgi:hypothetical protein